MNASSERTWWESLRHTGLLLGIAQVHELEQDYPVADLPETALNGLRKEMLLFDADNGRSVNFIEWCFDVLFGFGRAEDGKWLRGPNVPAQYSHLLITGESCKPRHIWIGAKHGVLPVFLDKNPRLGMHRGRKTYSDVLQWLRQARLPLAVLTNARQWRLVYAGLDAAAACDSDIDLWLEEGREGLQLRAIRQLLQPVLWDAAETAQPSALAAAISASRKGQAELSSVLGERVREAVEALVRAHGQVFKEAGMEGRGAEIYRAAVRIVMRMVVVLFAESRDLLPRADPVFFDNYSLEGLFGQLQRLAVRSRGRLALKHAAWPRILALFRLIYWGASHEKLPIRAYGGELFAPGDPKSSDPMLRALGIFETACLESQTGTMPDIVVHDMLELLTRTRVRVRQGRGTVSTLMPVDFGDLSSEYIGILYEGLLDYELRTAPSDDSIVFLALGIEPSLPLSRLEAMGDPDIKELVKELSKKNAGGDDGEEDEEESAEEEDGKNADAAAEENGEQQEEGGESSDDTSVAEAARVRALAWTRRACLAAGLVKKPKGASTPEKLLVYEKAVATAAKGMLRKLVPPGGWYLVRWGGTRKGSGTYYTRPQLAVPLVQRTLLPLAYDPPQGGGADARDNPQEWQPKKPEEILAIKMADIAGGSGSMPVAGLRFLTEALYKSLWAHNRIQGDGWRRPLTVILGLKEADSMEAERLPVPPADGEFEVRAKAILRRHVVERCIYAVDLDPLAVELCRMSLWIETMDRDLPFSFLDHKVKCGNSLVGCWFDQYRHYPAMAWDREGGDKSHANGVHFEKDARTQALKVFVQKQLKTNLQDALMGSLLAGPGTGDAATLHDAALAELRAIHDLPVQDVDERARRFKALEQGPEWRKLKEAFDRWCAIWFWPADKLDVAPLPANFDKPSEATACLARQIAATKRFFHWELEFPDVFDKSGAGFDAITGNPPWEIAKPSSKEFFSNFDPLYRTYGKQEALRRQTELFADERVEKEWLDYNAGFKDMSNFVGSAAHPYGDPMEEEQGGAKFTIARGRQNKDLHDLWRGRRQGGLVYADKTHPFRYQGSADLNLYKLFLEQAHTLLGPNGRMGYIVPSGIYSDDGSTSLRMHFLDHSSWEWLFGFENREEIFGIHRSFKFNPIIVQKGSQTQVIRTAFMRRNIDDWANAERFVTPYERERVTQFSPKSKAILEIQSARDLKILEKIYANSVLLGDDGPDGWGIEYAREFDMTNDSKLFPPRPKWEEQGYKPDEYSRWLKGNWRPIDELWKKLGAKALPEGEKRCAQPPYDTLPIPRADIPVGIVLSRKADAWMAESTIQNIALPVYNAKMFDLFDFSCGEWIEGKGRSALWQDIGANKFLGPEYLMQAQTYYAERVQSNAKLRLVFKDITTAIHHRTMLCSLVPCLPAVNASPIFSVSDIVMLSMLQSVLGSYCLDYVARLRIGYLHLNYFICAELPLPRPECVNNKLTMISQMLCCNHVLYSPLWMEKMSDGEKIPWRDAWAVAASERVRLRCISDALVAEGYRIGAETVNAIIDGCDYSIESINNHSDTLNPKGFWRVDKDKDPELRQTVLTLVAFHDLQAKIAECGDDRDKGIEAFLNQNGGEGWMLPETLRLADYGLGHDERAKEPQPVASRLGPRFFDWQLAQTPDESWKECRLHARNLLGEAGYKALLDEIEGRGPKPAVAGPSDSKKAVAKTGQQSLF